LGNHDAPARERATVVDGIERELQRPRRIAGPGESRVQHVRVLIRLDGPAGRGQALGHELPTEDPTRSTVDGNRAIDQLGDLIHRECCREAGSSDYHRISLLI
jgi:hypothetical protein